MTGGQSFWLGYVLATAVTTFLVLLAVRHTITWYRHENTRLRVENAVLRPRRDHSDRRRAVIPLDTQQRRPQKQRRVAR